MLKLIEILKRSDRYLKEHGIPDARRNAELLMSHILHKSRLELYLEYDRPLKKDEIDQMRSAIVRRKNREPIQYIFGEAEFYGLPFEVDPNVLVPRPETELLVEEALKKLGGAETKKAIVYDIGTGSGCIAVSLAKNSDNCSIYASDISAEALKVASRNAEKNEVAGRIEFLFGADLSPFEKASAPKADLIVTNPPYIPTADLKELQSEVRDYEPVKALDGGGDGLDVIRQVLTSAPEGMKPGASLIMEIGIGQSEAVSGLVESSGFFSGTDIRKDFQGIDRIVTVNLKK